MKHEVACRACGQDNCTLEEAFECPISPIKKPSKVPWKQWISDAVGAVCLFGTLYLLYVMAWAIS